MDTRVTAIKQKLITAYSFTKAAFEQWSDDQVPRLGAALAYYTLFSLAPMLVIASAVVGLVLGDEAARGEIVGGLQGFVGEDTARLIESLIRGVSKPSHGIVATVVGIISLGLGATTTFMELQGALNAVWKVRPKRGRGLRGMLRDRVLSFLMVIAIGALLVVSVVVSAAIAAISRFPGLSVPGLALVAQLLNIAVSLAMMTALFAMIYKVLPDVRLAWRQVWVGAAVTSVLFTVGKYLIGLYLGRAGVSSAYGAAGSVAVLLLWIYYSAQILLFGAELTYVYANRYGPPVQPIANAEWTPEHYARLAARRERDEARSELNSG